MAYIWPAFIFLLSSAVLRLAGETREREKDSFSQNNSLETLSKYLERSTLKRKNHETHLQMQVSNAKWLEFSLSH